MKFPKTRLGIRWVVSILFLLFLSTHLSAEKVEVSQAKNVAKAFLAQHFTTDSLLPTLPGSVRLKYVRESASTVAGLAEPATPLFYVFEFESAMGFVLVAADDRSYPVLGYSNQSDFDPDALHPEIRKWLENYATQMRDIIQLDLTGSVDIQEQWEALSKGKTVKSLTSFSSAGPLCATRWNQSPYFNQYCPYDDRYGERTVTGCVATAMAQIMKYWNHPSQGAGFHSYNHENYGTLSANFGAVDYNWTGMPNQVSAANDAVATLMFHCGISVDMNYGVGSQGGSGAYVITDASPVQHCSEYALENYFGYDKALQGIRRSSYTDANWINLLKTELNAGRPVLYAGFGSGGGHCFVCDGFNGDYFHMNWGWGGAYDGYFLISALNPSGQGTGGGTGGYNSNQQAVIGIKPPSNQTTPTDMSLYANLTANPAEVNYGGSFTVHTDVANFGENTFTGDFCVAIFDQDVNFVDFVEILSGYTLEAGYHYINGLDFSYEGSFTLLPGSYYLVAFYRPTNQNWSIIEDYGNYANLQTLKVVHENDIELYAPITLSNNGEIVQDEPFTVHLDIANYGSTYFQGTVDVSLYYLDGDFAEEIGYIDDVNLQSGYHFTNGLTFSSDGISVEPGTYLLALLYNPTGDDWLLAGSTYNTNPIQVIVKVAPLLPDPYENNNTREQGFIFRPTYTNASAVFQTIGSTIHSGEDYDFYSVYLEGGYTYTVNGRLHDSYSSGNGQIYTNDVMVSLLVEDYASDVYDDIMPTFTITAFGNGYADFYVTPYFTGETGTYLLDVEITRRYGTGVESNPLTDKLNIWPNPVTRILNINDLSEPVSRIRIVSVTGQVFMDMIHPESQQWVYQLDLQSLKPGNYMIEVTTAAEIMRKRFIKTQ